MSDEKKPKEYRILDLSIRPDKNSDELISRPFIEYEAYQYLLADARKLRDFLATLDHGDSYDVRPLYEKEIEEFNKKYPEGK